VTLPWKETSLVTARKNFIDDYLSQQYSVTELCQRYGISRKTGYKWIDRFMAGCELVDRSSRPHHSPRAVATSIEDGCGSIATTPTGAISIT
jgi:putative transposase